jgi:sugar (pentulose or hexulose) kinase
VGGGSKNELWNRIRSDVLSRKIIVSRFTEATVLGAALIALKGIGLYKNLDEAKSSLDYQEKIYTPITQNSETYKKAYKEFINLYRKLSFAYSK